MQGPGGASLTCFHEMNKCEEAQILVHLYTLPALCPGPSPGHSWATGSPVPEYQEIVYNAVVWAAFPSVSPWQSDMEEDALL